MEKPFIMVLLSAALPMAWSCASSWPEPKEPMVDAQAAVRSAHEIGADAQPAAKLKVTLAEEQIAAAKTQIDHGDNERATYLLIRARADAELALALAREQQALNDKQRAAGESPGVPAASSPPVNAPPVNAPAVNAPGVRAPEGNGAKP